MNFIGVIQAVLYGIVEGITEWLPISSTGHLILLESIWPMKVSEGFWKFFLVVVQLGAILAVIVYFWEKIWPFNTKVKNKPFVRYDILNMWLKVIVACIPAGVVGLLLDDWIDEHFYNAITVAVMLILVGLFFIWIENRNADRTPRISLMREITYRDAFIIGIFQMFSAVFPGTSRSGATIIGGLMIGLSRSLAAEFTFILAIPVMAGASLLKLIKTDLVFTSNEIMILIVGCLVAFAVSLWCVKFLMSFVRKHDFKPFGIYRIVLGIIVLAYFLILSH